MRKFLLASVATLGTGGLMVAAFAQAPTAAVGAPLQGQVAYPMANPIASVNNNNNYQAPALAGSDRKPYAGHDRHSHERQGADHLPVLMGDSLTAIGTEAFAYRPEPV